MSKHTNYGACNDNVVNVLILLFPYSLVNERWKRFSTVVFVQDLMRVREIVLSGVFV